MSRLIVSFTSHPKRINCVKTVLESLYAQTLKADEIILCLTEDEFSDKESDLPLPLREDLAAKKISVRWCDNLGSNTKYFYTMQEYPEDVIVTVDDDTFYHPDTLQSLMDMHAKFPHAVVARTASLVQFDSDFNLLPDIEWLFDFQLLTEPSMLLVAIGVGGVLYPPHSVSEKVFDKSFILESSTVNGRVCGDDFLLKAGEMLNQTPVVSVPCEPYYRLPNAEEDALASLMPNQMHNSYLINRYRKRFKDAFNEESMQRLKDAVYDFEEKDEAFGLRKKYWITGPSRDLKRVIGYLLHLDSQNKPRTMDYKQIANYAHFAAKVYTAFADGEHDEDVERAVCEFRSQLLGIPGIAEQAETDPILRGFIDYGVALTTECPIIYHGRPIRKRSLQNWVAFLEAHPDCDPVFRNGFKSFLKSLMTD